MADFRSFTDDYSSSLLERNLRCVRWKAFSWDLLILKFYKSYQSVKPNLHVVKRGLFYKPYHIPFNINQTIELLIKINKRFVLFLFKFYKKRIFKENIFELQNNRIDQKRRLWKSGRGYLTDSHLTDTPLNRHTLDRHNWPTITRLTITRLTITRPTNYNEKNFHDLT
jgi:hypothetical protein